MEFGLGLGVAQQMVNTMNHVMNNTQVAGVNAGTTGQPLPVTPPGQVAKWYVVADDRLAGPFTDDEMTKLTSRHVINAKTWTWTQGMSEWKKAEDIPEINKMILLSL